ncbi:uncharacterized protein LOC134230011 [Saccostrea cucullata]|uniref:uncharacterized protein LOC134230011 n=1 Tax=Saccostrea cuccullata TaxID=36930 RepID=UPI002ED0A889
MCPLIQPDSFINGPCVSGEALSESYDNAYGFVSDLWPPPATNWIKRSQQSWPTVNIVQKIVRDGCHFVPTGHKLGLQENLEWRISFSSAEQKLVFSMNHCQFLTYGLLKIFLKEVIKSKIGDQNMSSYHIKTSVFWAIQQSSMSQWCPQNLLECFWVCFKLILKWVYEGVCPNFFIPENNMFIHKIYGAKQMVLFHRLYDLYEKGFLGLLESPKIRSLITSQYQNLRPCVHTLEYTLIPQCEFDSELFEEISANDSAQVINLKQCLIALQSLEETVCWPLTHYQGIMVQKITATILQSTIFILHMCSNKAENRKKYIIDKMAVKVLKLAARFGYTFDTLFIIMYFYKTFRYTKALSVIEKMEAVLSRPETYIEVVSEKSLSTKIKQCTASYAYFDICNSIPYIEELINLQNHSHQSQWCTLHIPPLILLHMLKFLCYRHIDTGRAQFVLYDLQYLLNLNGDVIVPNNIRDISWHILGLCQELNENISDALYSYTQSFKQKNENRIKMATLMKIREITHHDLNVF